MIVGEKLLETFATCAAESLGETVMVLTVDSRLMIEPAGLNWGFLSS